MGAGGGRKLQIALYWGAGCGGCDVAVLDTHAFILEVAAAADIRFWPIAVDGKYQDVEAMADGELDATFFNGAVRNSENERLARLLRQKSKLLVAFGSCAHLGGIPGLANLCGREDILRTAYLDNPSLEAGSAALPRTETRINGAELELPAFYDRVHKLDDVVAVDYYVPGCPPAPARVKEVLLTLVSGQLPPKGAVLGASERALCEDCRRIKSEKRVPAFHRPHDIIQDFDRCLLEQGILCAGPATRSGCGVQCPDSGMPCRGCYGPLPRAVDQGAKLLSAVASILEGKTPEEISRALEGVPDIAGYAYRFGLPASLLQRRL